MVYANNVLSGRMPFCLHENEDAMRIMNQMEESMLWFDKSGLIVNANQASINLLSLNEANINEISVYDIFSDITPMHWFAYAKRIIDSEELIVNATIKNRIGADASVKIRFYLYQDHYCAFIKKSVETPVEDEKVNRLAYEYDRLIYRLSHDLRSPILTLKGLINLSKKEATTSQHQLLNLMEETVKKQCSLLADIHHLSLLDTSNLNVEEINLPKIINEIIEKAEKPDRPITWSFHFDLRDSFYSDEYFIKRLITPIIQNSIHFSGHGGSRSEIKISIESYDDSCQIIIDDNGIGIANDIKSKVFEMFFKGCEQSKGSGLGLYISKLAAKKLKGTISFMPKIQSGTVIKLRVPSYIG